MAESRDLVLGASEHTLRFFRVATWDPRIIPTNANRGTIASVVLSSDTHLMQKVDNGTTTGWVLIGEGGGPSPMQEYIKVFGAGEWVLQGAEFTLDVPHLLGDLTPIVFIFDSQDEETVCSYHAVTANLLRLSVPSNPDIRFAGSVRVTKT